MKIYLAARFSRALELRDYAAKLEDAGHEVVSTWIYAGETNDDVAVDPAAARRAAERDLRDIERADCVISFNEIARTPTRGGRHFEAGYGLARGKPLILVGPAEHVFHALPDVRRFDNFRGAFTAIDRSVRTYAK